MDVCMVQAHLSCGMRLPSHFKVDIKIPIEDLDWHVE